MPWLDEHPPRPQPPPSEAYWVRCERCGAFLHRETFLAAYKVCRHCGHHARLTAPERIESLVDPGSFSETRAGLAPADPLEFAAAGVRYVDKVAETTARTGLHEAVITGRGQIEGIDVALAVMDFRFLGGSLGSATGEKIYRSALDALEARCPLIVVSCSGGARMQEGVLSLMQMAKTCAALARLAAGGLPYVSVLTHPTTGGVSASFSMVGDVHIAEPGATIGFAGRRVIEQTIRETLPDDFQTAEYLLDHGFVDMVVERPALRERLARLLEYARGAA
jgi:acetyl-CoA carboxylase carboxyl transferase subunit beta